MIERICLENGYHYIESGNVDENDLRMVHICKILAKKICLIISL